MESAVQTFSPMVRGSIPRRPTIVSAVGRCSRLQSPHQRAWNGTRRLGVLESSSDLARSGQQYQPFRCHVQVSGERAVTGRATGVGAVGEPPESRLVTASVNTVRATHSATSRAAMTPGCERFGAWETAVIVPPRPTPPCFTTSLAKDASAGSESLWSATRFSGDVGHGSGDAGAAPIAPVIRFQPYDDGRALEPFGRGAMGRPLRALC